MDNKLVIQLLTSKTEEIQSLLIHFINEPKDLPVGIELLESRIQGLSQDFQILKKNCNLKPNPTILSNVSENTTIATAESIEPTDTINKELPIIKDVINEDQIIENKKGTELLTVTKDTHTEPIQLIGEKTSSQKLVDIQSAIGINDRFLFTRELFENNIIEYNTAISFVNETDKFESVMNWIKSEKEWDLEDPTVAQFIEITKRKF